MMAAKGEAVLMRCNFTAYTDAFNDSWNASKDIEVAFFDDDRLGASEAGAPNIVDGLNDINASVE